MRATNDWSELNDEKVNEGWKHLPHKFVMYLPSLWIGSGRMPLMARIVHSLSIITTSSIIEIPLATFLSRLEKELPIGVLAIFGPFYGNIACVSAAMQ
jgi:hypothetical protein